MIDIGVLVAWGWQSLWRVGRWSEGRSRGAESIWWNQVLREFCANLQISSEQQAQMAARLMVHFAPAFNDLSERVSKIT